MGTEKKKPFQLHCLTSELFSNYLFPLFYFFFQGAVSSSCILSIYLPIFFVCFLCHAIISTKPFSFLLLVHAFVCNGNEKIIVCHVFPGYISMCSAALGQEGIFF